MYDTFTSYTLSRKNSVRSDDPAECPYPQSVPSVDPPSFDVPKCRLVVTDHPSRLKLRNMRSKTRSSGTKEIDTLFHLKDRQKVPKCGFDDLPENDLTRVLHYTPYVHFKWKQGRTPLSQVHWRVDTLTGTNNSCNLSLSLPDFKVVGVFQTSRLRGTYM